MRNVELRQKYLACRAQAPHLQKEDSERAAVGVFVNYSLFGALSGVVGGEVGVLLGPVNVLGRNFDALLYGLVCASVGGLLSALILGVRKLCPWHGLSRNLPARLVWRILFRRVASLRSNWRMGVYVYFSAAAYLMLLVLCSGLEPEHHAKIASWVSGSDAKPASWITQNLRVGFCLCLGSLVGALTAVTIAFLEGEHRRLSHLGPLPWGAYSQEPRKLYRIFLISRPRPPSANPPSPKTRL